MKIFLSLKSVVTVKIKIKLKFKFIMMIITVGCKTVHVLCVKYSSNPRHV